MRCTYIRKACKFCGHRYKKGDDWNKVCPQCGGDRQCTNQTHPGYKRCGVMGHGGPAPNSGFYGMGKAPMNGTPTSKFPLTRLAGKYKEMQEDGRLLSNRHSIAIVRYRIGELLERIDQNAAPDRLMNLMKLWKKFQKARFHGDDLEVLTLQKDLDAEFEAAYHDYAAWKQMFEAVDLEKALVESEVKIAKDLKSILTAEDAYEMIAKVFAIIMQIEDDPNKLKRYQYELTRMVGDGHVVEAEWAEERERENEFAE